MLHIWVLNVGNGDSIVLKYDVEGASVYGVIDSNNIGNNVPKALELLQNLGAEELSFVALTHPHVDHYSGLLKILEAFDGRVHDFYSYPIGIDIDARVENLAKIYRDSLKNTDSKKAKSKILEFIGILQHVWNKIGVDNWKEFSGVYNLVTPLGFKGVDINAILPPAKVKGPYFEMINKGSTSIIGKEKENNLSLAFSVKYAGVEIVLGGDGTSENWDVQIKDYDRAGKSLESSVVKMPHHGSVHDCTEKVIDHLYINAGERYAVISADGLRHPHADVIKLLHEKNISPYCTNLAKMCRANTRHLINDPNVSPLLKRTLNMFAAEDTRSKRQPCQGDVHITIDDDGKIEIDTEYKHPCIYRDDFNAIFNNN